MWNQSRIVRCVEMVRVSVLVASVKCRRMAVLVFAGLAGGTLAFWSAAQVANAPAREVEAIEAVLRGRFADEQDIEVEKWARFAIKAPREALDIREPTLNEKDRRDREQAVDAILQPDAYVEAMERQRLDEPDLNPGESDAREFALVAILRPNELARELEQLNTAGRGRAAVPARPSILFPLEVKAVENTGETERKAEAIHALSQPERFKTERRRLRETGQALPPKVHSDDEVAEKAKATSKGGKESAR